MSTIVLDATRYPNLAGVERPFFEYWRANVLSDDDPHRDRWIEYEEGAVARAERRNDLIQRLRVLEGADVLDVGCQNGAWLVALGLAGARPTGIDVVPTAIEAAKRRTAAYGIDAHVELASACELPFASRTFDVVASSDVLEHVPDKLAMLYECARVVRPGGLVVLRAPTRFGLKNVLSDPHYQHPGISVLPGRVAGWVATRLYHELVYEAETLPTKAWTVRQLRRMGMDILDLPPDHAGRPVPGPPVVTRVADELRQCFTIVAGKPPSPFDGD
jgi:SAM-dependent methyltransferase